MQDAGDAEGEVEVGGREARAAVRGRDGDGGFICTRSCLVTDERGARADENVVKAEWECSPVTSNSSTSSRWASTSRPSRMRAFVPFGSVRAVAMIGKVVVRRSWRVKERPMPREAGEARIHGWTMVYIDRDKYDTLAVGLGNP